ncbi:MAG: hypothetical protein IPM35_10550 [Myxococcales bacterium]|nr:hypothetical protein [Myxococcales bacterium]
MRRSISIGLVVGLLAACGGESEGGGSGGSSSGGSSASGGGGAGGSVGGSGGASGGSGGASGGSAGTGGASGGSAGSGGASGGAGGTGGSSTCSSENDCVASVYTKLVASEADCYCLMCPTVALTKTESDARAAAWTKHCTAWEQKNPCPVPSCIQPPPVACEGGQCTFGGAEAGCTSSGGTVSKGLCCTSTSDFPNTCVTGACGCSPANSHEVKTCQCPSGKCFDGSKCQ